MTLICYPILMQGAFVCLHYYQGRWLCGLPVSPADYACAVPWRDAWVWSWLSVCSFVVLLVFFLLRLVFWKIACFCLQALIQLPHTDRQLPTSDLYSLYYLLLPKPRFSTDSLLNTKRSRGQRIPRPFVIRLLDPSPVSPKGEKPNP